MGEACGEYGREEKCIDGLGGRTWRKRTAWKTYEGGSKSFRPDIQKPRQMENAARDI